MVNRKWYGKELADEISESQSKSRVRTLVWSNSKSPPTSIFMIVCQRRFTSFHDLSRRYTLQLHCTCKREVGAKSR